MTSYVMNFKIPTGDAQRPVQSPKQSNESNTTHSQPFFLQRPTVSSELASRLIPIDVDLHTKKNAEEHSTQHYDISGLVLRRGKSFSFTVTFNRDFDLEQFQLFVRLATGSQSMISKGTQIRISVNEKSNENGWSAKIIPTTENDEKKNSRVSFQIDSPANAIIGKYTLLLEIRPVKSEEKDLTLFLFEVDLYFLFNPWNKDDTCALSSSEQISEYVMNEHGQIYLGTSDKPEQIPWYYGQFENSALLTALNLLDKAQLPAQSRVNPSIILRILSSRICSNPGTNTGIFPSAFNNSTVAGDVGYTSSSSVLKQYQSRNYQTIQGGSGHNWQHAAILCSLSRALGIPCRIVTVYNSAYRADETEHNDIHWDPKQRPLRRLNADIICSARVWNECWMRREDLSASEAEWQVVDSTPIQMCDGIRRTGPCSVSSIKKGQLGFRWDSPFIHSSIHGQKKNWFVSPDGYMKLLNTQDNGIGTKILTRSLANEFQAEDLTEKYKTPKKSSDEKDQTANDVEFQLKLPEEIFFGNNLQYELNAKNKSKESRTITVAWTICLLTSAGQKLIAFTDHPIQTVNLQGEKDETIQLKVPSETYSNRGKEDNLLVKYYLNAQIKETDQTFLRDDNIVFNKIDIIKPILKQDVIEIGKPVLLELQIANTLSRTIKPGRVYIDGLGVNQIISVNRSFAPKDSATLQVKINPRRTGVSRLYVTFISSDVCSLTQTIPLEILAEPIKVPDEPLLKTEQQTQPDTSAATPPPPPPPSPAPQEKPAEKVEETPAKVEDKTPTTPETVEEKPQEHSPTKTSPEIKLETISSENESETEDDVEKIYLKKKNKPTQSTKNANTLAPFGSTSSLDKDKISIDSLDISNDRRQISNNNNNNNH